MSRILQFVYCDQVQNTMTPQGQSRNIITPLVELRPISIPGNYTFSIASTYTDFNVHENNHFEVCFQDPEGKTINKIDAVIPTDMLINADTGTADVENLNLDMDFRNVILQCEGIYKTVVIHNGIIIGEYPISVKKAGIK